MLYDKGNFAEARQAYENALVVFRNLGNQGRVAGSLNNIGNVYYDMGDLDRARQYYEQAIAAYREIDDKSGLAGGLGNLANVFDGMGNLPEALKMQQAGLAAFREIGDQRGTASTLSNLGNLQVEIGDLTAAEANYTEALQVHTQTGYKRGMAFALPVSRTYHTAGRSGTGASEVPGSRNYSPRSWGTAQHRFEPDAARDDSLEEGHEAESESLIRTVLQNLKRRNFQATKLRPRRS